MINIDNAVRIMANYMPLIYATIKRFDIFEQEEAIDEAKMVLIETILIYDENQGTFGNFLKHCLNYHFWDKAKKPIPLSLEENNRSGKSLKETLASSDDIEKDFFTNETYKDLYENIMKLDKKDILIIKLKYWGNLTDKEIGRLMGLSPKTIRNRHSMAIRRLRELMDK